MNGVKCPVCGEVNPPDNEFCQNCMSRLQPLTGPLKGEDAPLQPGQIPTKKVTAELEPILPQWLREARATARQNTDQVTKGALEEPATTPRASQPDLLAGLAKQGRDDEDETPDWLAGVTGNAPSKKKKFSADDSQVKWVELGGPDDFPGEEGAQQSIGATDAPSHAPVENTTPKWMMPQGPVPEKDELQGWLSQPGPAAAPVPDEPVAPAAPPDSTPADDSNWLSALQSQPYSSYKEEAGGAPAQTGNVPDWLNDLQAAAPVIDQGPEAEKPVDLPQTDKLFPLEVDVPDWLKEVGQSQAAEAPAAGSDQSLDWLKDTVAQTPPTAPSPFREPAATEPPDWMSSLGTAEAAPASKAFAPPEPATNKTPSTPAFKEEPLEASSDMDSLFSSFQMPDWLASAAPKDTIEPSLGGLPPAAQANESITPADLPSWVQAMRPVETPPPYAAAGSDAALETQGPLAGLQGVLPAVPDLKLTSKPKAHSIKLNASEEQQAQSALLEQILAAETAPIPMKAIAGVASQRLLRWILTGLLFFFLGVPFLLGTQIFPFPSAVLNETRSAVETIDRVPADAPVLVIFDYQPSTVGEMEAVSAPFIDHLILLKHPRLAFLSTSPTGAALAERFMSTTQAGHNYQRDAHFVDLGYLAGGLAAVRDFAQNPTGVILLSTDQSPVWQTPAMQGVNQFSDFASIIILTDSAEAGRVWIEQAGPLRGRASLVVLSSAQAGPLLLPYYSSAQADGLVSGLNNAAAVELGNGGRPGFVRRYWDAYSLGLLLASGLIVLGGLWSFIAGAQARRTQEKA